MTPEDLISTAGNAAKDITIGDAPTSLDSNSVDEVVDMNDRAPSGNPIFVVAKCPVDLVEKLTAMGYSLVASEKALYYSAKDADQLGAALRYLELHELSDKINIPVPPIVKSSLTEEEKMASAVALQKKLREKIQLREKEEMLEQAKSRMAMSKNAHETMEAIQDAERKRQIMKREQEKKLDAQWKQELRQKQIDDYRERFGTNPPDDFFTNQHQMKDHKKKLVTEIIMGLQRDLIATNRDGLRSCFTLLLTYLTNVQRDPLNIKYKKIKMSNKHFVASIAPYREAVDLLETIGFERAREEDREEYLILKDLPSHTCGDAIKYLKLLIDRM